MSNDKKQKIIDEIVERVFQLSEDNRRKFWEYTLELYYQRTREILKEQPCPSDINILFRIVDDDSKANRDSTLTMLDIYQYGRIEGIRQERRRKRSRANG